MAITTVTVNNTFVNPDGTIPSGQVEFVLNSYLADSSSGKTISQGVVIGTIRSSDGVLLGPSGGVGVPLVATNDASVFPQGVMYQVTYRFKGEKPIILHYVLPAADYPSVTLAALVPMEGFDAPPAGALAAHVQDMRVHSSGHEIGYAENLAGMVVTDTQTDIPNCGVTFVAGIRPIAIEVTALMSASVTGSVTVNVHYGIKCLDTNNANAQLLLLAYRSTMSGAASSTMASLMARKRLGVLSAGSHTYKLAAVSLTTLPQANSAVILGNAAYPIALSVKEL